MNTDFFSLSPKDKRINLLVIEYFVVVVVTKTFTSLFCCVVNFHCFDIFKQKKKKKMRFGLRNLFLGIFFRDRRNKRSNDAWASLHIEKWMTQRIRQELIPLFFSLVFYFFAYHFQSKCVQVHNAFKCLMHREYLLTREVVVEARKKNVRTKCVRLAFHSYREWEGSCWSQPFNLSRWK